MERPPNINSDPSKKHLDDLVRRRIVPWFAKLEDL